MRLHRSYLSVLILSFFSVACEKCRPDLVGPGVARLTVRNVGAIAELINSDTRCGFEAPDVKESFATDGTTGGAGKATWSVSDCEIDLGKTPVVETDCNGNETRMSGRVIVSAKRTIAGTLTGNLDQPVIPLNPSAVTIELEHVQLHNFLVEASNSDSKLTQISGALSAKVKPKLAASESTGVCMVPTSNAFIDEVHYEQASVRVVTADRDFVVDVPSSDFWAVNGKFGNEENSMSGSITVWSDAVPVPGDEDGLDPEYDAEKFVESFSCTEDLKNPVTYECGDVAPILAQGAARLTIRNLGAIANATELDTTCGFSSQTALNSAVLSGPAGSNGSATFRVENCTIDLSSRPVFDTDCLGGMTLASGRITVTATKKLTGRLSGDLTQPVVPVTDTPAEIEIVEARFESFKIEEGGTSLTMVDGAISGKIRPRVAMDTAVGACAAKTPVARFENVSYRAGSKLKIAASQGTFDATVDASNLSAVNGTFGTESNLLDGTITMSGETYNLPTDPADDGLDPEYDEAAFNAAWICDTIHPTAPFECSVAQTLGRGAAQLSVLTMGTIANLIEADTACGFSSAGVLDSVQTSGPLGDAGGSAVFTIGTPCALSFSAATEADADCNGKKTFVQGTATVRGTKTLSGYVSGDRLQPIVPTTRDPAQLALEVTFSDFRVYTSEGDNALSVRSGVLSATVNPRTAIDLGTGACSIPTPVARIDNITWSNGSVIIESQGKTFGAELATSALQATNGVRDGVTNRLTGSITVDGELIPIDGALDPLFNEATFNASYACTPNMGIPANDDACNMKKPLAEGTARLLVSALGTVTGVANANDDCGFAANLTDPSAVVGEPGQQGAMEWDIVSCALERGGDDAAEPYETDCLGRAAYHSGVATVTGKRRVTGLREEINLIFVRFDSIVPNSRESVTVTENMIAFNEFNTYELDRGQTTAARGINIHNGTASAVVVPILGEQEDEAGTFDVPTKVARLSNINVQNANVTIVYEGKTFNVRVDSASLSAFNGSYAATGEKNMIQGSITVAGSTFTLAPQPLDPDFNQADFDARYACTDNLRATVPAAP
jgi:hypothetical protein